MFQDQYICICVVQLFQDLYIYIHDCISDAIKQGLHLPPGDASGDASEHVYCRLEHEPDAAEDRNNNYESLMQRAHP